MKRNRDVCRKTFILFLITLLLTSIVISSINASKVISVTNILTDDPEPPITALYYDELTGYVYLIAVDLPLNDNITVYATYYKIDSGEKQMYTGPFKVPEGRHTIEYWSVNTIGNEEYHHRTTLIFDTTPPTVEIIEPETGSLYLLGTRSMNRIYSDTILCIGKVPIIKVDADDKDGYGVSRVFFSYSDGETSYDDNSSDGWSSIYSNMHFGNLTLSVSAMDKKGLISEPVNITILVYSFGFFGRN